MVGMFIPADGVERNNDIRLDRADVFHHLASHLFDGMIDLRIGVLIRLHARHARIAIAEKNNFFQTQFFRGSHQLISAHLSGVFEAFHKFFICRAYFAARCTNIVRFIAALFVQRQRSTQTERLIVGMC